MAGPYCKVLIVIYLESLGEIMYTFVQDSRSKAENSEFGRLGRGVNVSQGSCYLPTYTFWLTTWCVVLRDLMYDTFSCSLFPQWAVV
jgi:hypothetical protein